MKFIVFLVIVGIIVYAIYNSKNGTKKIKREKIVEQWSVLIVGANGEGERVITDTIRAIEQLEAPNIHVSREVRKPGPGYIKTHREFLIAEHRILDGYDMYIGARDYGKQLFVSWYLLEEPISFRRLFKRNPLGAITRLPSLAFWWIISVIYGGGGKFMSTLNLFDSEELTAYVTTVHHALLDSAKAMMADKKLDFTKVEDRTRGFLNIV